MTKITIEISLDDLPHEGHHEKPDVKVVPVVEEHNDDAIAKRGQIWYRELKRDEDRWVRAEARGETPFSVNHFMIRASPANPDVNELRDEITGYDKDIGGFVYADHPNDFYIQSLKLDQLYNLGYIDSRNNLPPRVLD